MSYTVGGAVRATLTGGFLALGLWSALPSLLEMRVPAPFALPTPLSAAQPTALARPATQATVRAQGTTTVSLTERDLTRAAEPYFPQTYSGITVSSPSVRVASGRVVLTATARSVVGTGPLVATATPSASGGQLVLRVDSATLSGMTLPDAMRAQIAGQMQAAIDAYTGTRLHVTQVTTAAGVLTLKGNAVP